MSRIDQEIWDTVRSRIAEKLPTATLGDLTRLYTAMSGMGLDSDDANLTLEEQLSIAEEAVSILRGRIASGDKPECPVKAPDIPCEPILSPQSTPDSYDPLEGLESLLEAGDL